jgi:hypothetical protein
MFIKRSIPCCKLRIVFELPSIRTKTWSPSLLIYFILTGPLFGFVFILKLAIWAFHFHSALVNYGPVFSGDIVDNHGDIVNG